MTTQFISYDELTWPEIAALPRQTPLLLPLGASLDMPMIARELGDPAQIVILPAFPFGWRGSGLEVSTGCLSQCLHNLLEGLHQDGFINAAALAPANVDLDMPQGWRIESGSAPGKTAPPAPSQSDTQKVIIIPVGHTEQHGFHLPMSTDTLIIDAIGQGIVRLAPDAAACLPVMPYGVSTHRQAFAGTLNTGGRAFEDFWLEAIDSLVSRGFDRFYMLSGHGGNCSFLTNIVKYAGERHRRIFCATSWLYLSGPAGMAALEQQRSSPIGGMGHACELETALILHLRPELVHMQRVVDEMDFIATPSYMMDWVEGGAIVANPPWDDDTATGAYGAGSLATPQKGAFWLKAAIEEKAGHVAEIHEQHRRREARRQTGYGRWGKT